MENVYLTCMIIGIGIPLISLLLGGLGDIFHGVLDSVSNFFDGLHMNFDFGFEIGEVTLCLLPFSMQSICTGLLLYGTTGRLFYNGGNLVAVNIAGGILGYLSAVIMQSFIRKLKSVKHTTHTQDELLIYDGKVVNTIQKGGYGSISISTRDNINSTYPARAEDPGDIIRQDTIVYIIRFEKNVAIVRTKELTLKGD